MSGGQLLSYIFFPIVEVLLIIFINSKLKRRINNSLLRIVISISVSEASLYLNAILNANVFLLFGGPCVKTYFSIAQILYGGISFPSDCTTIINQYFLDI